MADNVEMDPNHPAALALGEIAPELVELPQQEPEQQQLTLADIQIALATMSTTQVELQQVLGHFMTTSKTQLEANAKKSSSTSVRVKEPRVFDGHASELEPFLRELRAAVHLQRAGLATSYDKAQYMLPYLKAPGRPSEWFSAIEKTKKNLLNDFDALLKDFKSHFESSDLKAQMQRKLEDLVQTGAASDYAAAFYDITSHLDLTEESKMLSFRRGLKPAVLDGLALIIPQPSTLANMVLNTTTIDDNQHQNTLERKRRNQRNGIPTTSNNNVRHTNNTQSYAQAAAPSPSTQVVPMEIDAFNTKRRPRLTPEERKRRFDNKLCLYCGNSGHVVSSCPTAPKKDGKPSAGQAKAAATSQASGSSGASPATSGNAKKESK